MPTRHFSTLGTGGTQYKGCGHPDPGHGWESGRAQLNGGFLAPGSGNDEFALTYFNQGDLGFIHDAARATTRSYDRYFCSILASHLAEPLLQVVGPVRRAEEQHDRPRREQLGDDLRPRHRQGPDRALLRLGPALRRAVRRAARAPGSTRSRATTTDCFRGKLPNIAIVDPPFRDGGGGDGLSADEHPLGDVRLGQAFMADVVNAFVTAPKGYRRGALFVIYDEWGGFFDHVRPPARHGRPRQPRPQRGLRPDGLPGPGGRRLAVRPARQEALAVGARPDGWGQRHFNVDHGLYGHESILKFISYRFGLGDLNKRMKFANNIGRSFEWQRPDFEEPGLPDPPTIVTQPCALGGGDVLDSPAGPRRATSPTSSTWPSATSCPSTRARPTTSSRCRTRSRRASRQRPSSRRRPDHLGSAAMETRLLIRGEQVAGEGAALAVENPATEETVAEVGCSVGGAARRRDRRRARGRARVGGHAGGRAGRAAARGGRPAAGPRPTSSPAR